MAGQTPPEPWASAMERRDFTYRGEPAYGPTARAAGMSVETLRRLCLGIGNAEPETVEKVSKALDVPLAQVSEWAGRARDTIDPYTPPAEVAWLTERQRRALDELIRAIAEPTVRPDGDRGDPPTVRPTMTEARARLAALLPIEEQDRRKRPDDGT